MEARTATVTATTTITATVLRLEGAAVFAASLLAFQYLDGAWFWFVVLFLVPDLFMLGYFAGPRIGAFVYNVAHTYLFPAAIVGVWLVVREVELLQVAAIWTAHIGFDRLLGFGLKDATGFKHTHLHRV
jgi:hypothetical protein